jgi:hypothetical protein
MLGAIAVVGTPSEERAIAWQRSLDACSVSVWRMTKKSLPKDICAPPFSLGPLVDV